MLSLRATLLTLILATTSSVVFGESWERHTFDLSGHTLSVSAPKGHFRDKYLAKVDPTTNEKPYVTLLKKAWVFPGFIADQGGLDFIVALNRAELGTTEEDFLSGLKNNVTIAYQRLRPQGIQIGNITKRQLGGQEWLCYSIADIDAECALRIDSRYYVSWRLLDINNASSSIRARDQLRKKIPDRHLAHLTHHSSGTR